MNTITSNDTLTKLCFEMIIFKITHLGNLILIKYKIGGHFHWDSTWVASIWPAAKSTAVACSCGRVKSGRTTLCWKCHLNSFHLEARVRQQLSLARSRHMHWGKLCGPRPYNSKWSSIQTSFIILIHIAKISILW